MKLADTVQAMTSDDYKDRLWAEYWQNKIRIDGLENYILQKKSGCVLDIEQLDAMRRYQHVLEIRCQREGVPV